MRRILSVALLGTALMGVPIFTGCDRDDVKEVKTVTQNPDGSTTTTQKKTDVDPKTGNGTVSIEQKTTGAPANPNRPPTVLDNAATR